jgi:hypothetical protein
MMPAGTGDEVGDAVAWDIWVSSLLDEGNHNDGAGKSWRR